MAINAKKMLAQAQAAAEKWLAQESVELRVQSMLHSRLEAIAAQLLGFNPPRWSGDKNWEIDNWNGRTANTAAGDYIRQKASDAVRKALDDLAGDLPPLPKSARKSLVMHYHERVSREVRDELSRLAVEHAKGIAKRIFDEVEAKEGVA